jgi:hypothetical protein
VVQFKLCQQVGHKLAGDSGIDKLLSGRFSALNWELMNGLAVLDISEPGQL